MSTSTASVHGTCPARFGGVREAFARNLASGDDVGASFAVTIDGELAIDLWGGFADAARTRAWERDTIVNVYSSTKTMSFLCFLVLADRGEIDLRAPVARYWPEFAANGKQGVELRHLMSHSAGIPAQDAPLTEELLYDRDRVCRILAAQAPWWEPGTASGYHALIQGHLIGEVVRRVTGQSLGQFFRKEIAEPLGADFHIGLDPVHFPRVAELIPYAPDPNAPVPPPDSIAARTFARGMPDPAWTRGAGWRRAEIPAANGHGNARAMALTHAPLACGGSAQGKRLLSPATCESVLEVQTDGVDLVIGVPVRFGLGYARMSETFPFSPNPRACFWGGWGGSLVVADLDARVSIGFAMNQMRGDAIVGDRRTHALCKALYEAL